LGEEPLDDFTFLRCRREGLYDCGKLAQTIAAMPQKKRTPPRPGIENTNAAAPSARSQIPAVDGLIDRLLVSARSVFWILIASSSIIAEAAFLTASWKATSDSLFESPARMILSISFSLFCRSESIELNSVFLRLVRLSMGLLKGRI
jgi:hypothetical protein